ncbi:MAG: glycosyltransferase family 4 protein [Nitrospinae bacterium]|nr:glycosyltransferase family 4 protein [Nitrospinota bacterium]
MRLAVLWDPIFYFDGREYSTNVAFVRFITAFDIYFEKIIFLGRVSKERRRERYILDPEKTDIVALPFYNNFYTLWREWIYVLPSLKKILQENIDNFDLVWLCNCPNPLSLVVAYFCKKNKKPLFIFVRQDLVEQVRHSNKGFKKVIAMIISILLEAQFRYLSSTFPTFTVGERSYQRYKKDFNYVHRIAVSLISRRDLIDYPKDNINLNKKIRLLSVGRLSPEKGQLYLIHAIRLLVEKGIDLVLNMVGVGIEEERLRQEVYKLRLNNYIRFLGYITNGPELMKIYKDSDIFILPSLTEGLPVVLFESMASGVPVIASGIKGIRSLIEDRKNGLLVKPKDPQAIAYAIEELINNEDIRKRCIKNGLETAKENTIEDIRAKTINILNSFYHLNICEIR